MSRRSLPPVFAARIEPRALRDHGDTERVDRVWDRLERNLALSPPERTAPRSRRFGMALAAAVFAGFVVGYVVHGAFTDGPAGPAPVPVAEQTDESDAPTVFAAGAEPQVYPLPGGGFIKVERNSIVDVVNRGQQGLTLRLVRGEATVSTLSDTRRTSRLALQFGRAELVTAAGSMRVRLDGESADLEVLYGSASLNAPDEDVQQRELAPGRQRVRVAVVTSERQRTAQRPRVLEPEPESVDGVVAVVPEPVLLAEPAPLAKPAWIEACDKGEDLKAAELIQKEPGGADAALAGVTSPDLLACIGTGHDAAGNKDAAIAAHERTLRESNDSGHRLAAAHYLARLYREKGDKVMATHYERVRAQEAQNQRALLSPESLCKNIEAAHQAKNAQEVAQLSKIYRRQFPDGECIDLIAKLEAELRAKGKAQPPEPPADEYEDEEDTGASDSAPK